MRLRRFYGVCIILSLMILVFSSLPAKADFNLYDADGQLLGIFLSAGDLAVYNSSIDKVIIFEEDESLSPKGKYADILVFDTVYYKEDGCQGFPYVYSGHQNADLVGKIPGDDNAYHVNTNSSAVFIFKSRRDASNGTCNDTNGTSDAFYFGLSTVTLPFSTPIRVPYRIEHVDPGVAPKAKVVVIPLGD